MVWNPEPIIYWFTGDKSHLQLRMHHLSGTQQLNPGHWVVLYLNPGFFFGLSFLGNRSYVNSLTRQRELGMLDMKVLVISSREILQLTQPRKLSRSEQRIFETAGVWMK